MLLKINTMYTDDDFIVYTPSLEEFKAQVKDAIADYDSSLVLSSYDREYVQVIDCDSASQFTASVVPESNYIYWVIISGTVNQLKKLDATETLKSKGFFNSQNKNVEKIQGDYVEDDTPFTLLAYRVLPENGGEVRTHFTLDEIFDQ